MSVAEELQKYNDGLLDAYDAVDAKGGTIPQNKNLDNLPTAIGSISGGDVPPQPLDPMDVYRDTRPAEWLKMPRPAVNEMYILIIKPSSVTYDVTLGLYFNNMVSSDYGKLEFGVSDSNGNFIADDTLTLTVNGGGAAVQTVPASAFVDCKVGVTKQLICKVSSSTNITSLYDTNGGHLLANWAGEISLNLPYCTGFSFGGQQYAHHSDLRYCSVLGIGVTSSQNFGLLRENEELLAILELDTSAFTNFSTMFNQDRSLLAIPSIDTSSGTNFQSMFSGCADLQAIPQIDTSNGTVFESMFSGCADLQAIPQIDTSNGTNFKKMFYSSGIKSIPQLDTSKATTMSQMFSSCSYLEDVPLLDTSLVTDFYGMFSSCRKLKKCPQLDVKSGTTFGAMFNGCSNLTDVPSLDTRSGTNFADMFTSCYKLEQAPQMDTSGGTSFQSMFNGCRELKSVPLYDTSEGLTFGNMFNDCASLDRIPQLDTSKGTNFIGMLSGCYNLKEIPQLNTSAGTNFSGMFLRQGGSYGAYPLYMDLSSYDFSSASGTSALGRLFADITGQSRVILGDSFGSSGITTTQSLVGSTRACTQLSPAHIKIDKTDAMLPIAVNATTLFSSDAYVYVYVPDDLLATYQADTYWATLGARLKGFSELPN